MENEFQKRQVLCYSNFMKYIISFSLFNILLIIIENCSIIYSVDIMLGGDKILNELFTPFYFLSPHLYVEMLNEKLPNQCFSIFQFNTSIDNDNDIINEDIKQETDITTSDNSDDNNHRRMEKTNKFLEAQIKYRKHRRKKNKLKKIRFLDDKQNETNINNETDKTNSSEEKEEEDEDPLEAMYQRMIEEPYFDIKFRGHLLRRFDNSYCVYNKNLIYISFAIVLILFILIVLLFFLNTRTNKSLLYKILGYTLTNLINIIIRPLFIAVVAILVNRPLLYLYRGTYMSSDYKIEEIIYMFLSLIFLIFFIVLTYLLHDFINNIFCFEDFPYDCFITSEENVLMFVKVCIGFKITYDKIMGLNEFSVINLIIGLFVFYRLSKSIGSADFVVNHLYLKMTRNFFFIFLLYINSIKINESIFELFQDIYHNKFRSRNYFHFFHKSCTSINFHPLSRR